MYIDVKINGKPIGAIVDTDATHNYFANTEVEHLGLVIEKGSGKVKVINSGAQPIARVVKIMLIKGRTNLFIVQIDDFKVISELDPSRYKLVVFSYPDSLMTMRRMDEPYNIVIALREMNPHFCVPFN